MQSKCISVKGINVYLVKRKKNMSLKFHINSKGNCMESYYVKKEDIGILHNRQAFTIFLHSPEKHDILYCKSGIYYKREHVLQWLKKQLKDILVSSS